MSGYPTLIVIAYIHTYVITYVYCETIIRRPLYYRALYCDDEVDNWTIVYRAAYLLISNLYKLLYNWTNDYFLPVIIIISQKKCSVVKTKVSKKLYLDTLRDTKNIPLIIYK